MKNTNIGALESIHNGLSFIQDWISENHIENANDLGETFTTLVNAYGYDCDIWSMYENGFGMKDDSTIVRAWLSFQKSLEQVSYIDGDCRDNAYYVNTFHSISKSVKKVVNA